MSAYIFRDHFEKYPWRMADLGFEIVQEKDDGVSQMVFVRWTHPSLKLSS